MTETATNESVIRLCRLDELEQGHPYQVAVGAEVLVLVRIEDEVYALQDRCTHQNVQLSEGEVLIAEREIECHRHGSTFSLATGEAQSMPATKSAKVYPVRVEQGEVYLLAEGD